MKQKLILAILTLALTFFAAAAGLPRRAKPPAQNPAPPAAAKTTLPQGDRARVLAVALSQAGVTEATGHNDGPQVEAYLAATGNKAGDPWCASFVYWCAQKALGASAPYPRSAWSPDMVRGGTAAITTARPADCFGIMGTVDGERRICHTGLVRDFPEPGILRTVEGNTNAQGSREGNRVAVRLREVATIAKVKAWLP